MTPALLTGLFGIGEKLIDHWFPNSEESDKRKYELLALIKSGQLKELESAAQVITAEAQSQHWIVAAWRPILMLLFGLIIANNYIIYPYLSLFWDNAPQLTIPPDMWQLLKIGIGGYIVGRSGEKIIKNLKPTGGQ